MNTTAAALQAHVTVATIRLWARRGVVAATKTAGRWIIDAASLAHRITIGTTHRKTTVTEQTRTYTPDELKSLTIDEKKAIRTDAKARADQARTRIRTAIQLPALTGTPKQISWAENLRAAWIEHALEFVAGTRFGAVRLNLAGAGADPLHLFDLNLIPEGGYATEADLLDALHKALTTTDGATFRGATGDRTAAAWWINHR